MPIRAVMPIRDSRDVRARIARLVSADRKADFGTLRASGGTLFLRRCTQGPRGSANPAHPGDDRAEGAWSAQARHPRHFPARHDPHPCFPRGTPGRIDIQEVAERNWGFCATRSAADFLVREHPKRARPPFAARRNCPPELNVDPS